MSLLPRENDSFKELYDLLNAALKARIMLTGLELGIFEHLAEPLSAAAVADKMGMHSLNTARFLDALAVIGLVRKEQGRYSNTTQAAKFLSRTSPTFAGDLLSLSHMMTVSRFDRVLDLIRNGPSAGAEEDLGAAEFWAQWTKAGAQWVLGRMGQTIAGIVSGLPGFDGFERMVDLGGGHGMFTLYLLQAHPTLKGAVLDRPPVLDEALEFSRKYGLEDRFTALPGDYINGDIGADYDLVFASATLNFAKDRLEEVIAKIYRALKPGGYFISFQEGMIDERTRPETMLGHLLDSLGSERDFMFDQGEIAETMLRTGFKQVRSRTFETHMGPMDLDIARK